VLANVSAGPCVVQGYGEVTFVSRSGEPVGAASEPDAGRTAPRTVLRPGERAESALDVTSYAQFGEETCRPQPVDGWRVELPGGVAVRTERLLSWACSNTEVRQMRHTAFR
jgi:hypothetical protein